MSLEEKFEAVKKVSAALGKDGESDYALERMAPNKEKFDDLMGSGDSRIGQQPQGERINEVTAVESPKGPSLIEEVKKLTADVDASTKLSPVALKEQINGLVAQIEQVRGRLQAQSAEDVSVHKSYQELLTNKLRHIDEKLQVTLTKAGVEYTPPAEAVSADGTKANVLQRFLGLLTHGQYQLEHLSQTIDQLNLKGEQLTPMSMLSLQIKVGQVQQEIELFSSLLNKSLESVKTIMNVQV